MFTKQTHTQIKSIVKLGAGALCLTLASPLLHLNPALAQGAGTQQNAGSAEGVSDIWDRFHPGLSVTSLSLYNASLGSRKRRWGNAGGAYLTLDVDLEKDRRDNGVQFHFMHTFFPFMHSAGNNADRKWSGFVGAYHAGAAQHNDNTWGYLSRFSLSNRFLDDKLYLEAGRINARHVFKMDTCDTLMLTCTEPMNDTATGSLPPPYGSWGLYGRYDMGSQYVHAGAFEYNWIDVVAKKTGWDWRTRNASGALLIAGFGNAENYTDTPWAGNYEVNVFSQTARQTNAVTGHTTQGNNGLLLRARQAIWRADGGRAGVEHPEAIELFGAYSHSFYNANAFRFNAEVGATWRGFWRSRPTDHVNLRLNWLRLSDNQREFQRLARLAAGGASVPTRANSMRVALDAQFALSDHSFVELSAQYTHNPDSFHNPFIPDRLSGGTVLGVQFFWDIGSQLGW